MTTRFQKKLRQLESQDRLRTLSKAKGIDLASNDYLGFSTHPVLKQAALEAIESGLPMGSVGSRLLRGHHDAHAELEEFAAQYFGCEKTLFFANGFMANYAIFTTLPERHDVVLYDALSHASVRDGLHAGPAQAFKTPHNDVQAFEEGLKKYSAPGKQVWMAVESIYSMEGDMAPLEELHALATQYGAILIVDEAHGTGIFGAHGKGASEDLPHENMITLHTGGKALGVAGGLVCGSTDIIDTMINQARPFIFSTAPMPLQAFLMQKALELVQAEPWRREKLLALRDTANALLGTNSPSQIIPVILGEDARTVRIAATLQAAGYDVRAIRPPAVPDGTARLRIPLNLGLDGTILRRFAHALNESKRKEAA
ncbi:MAG: 8-amino-7-oxononanoate synthase [Alphaproteobacteria bacterium]